MPPIVFILIMTSNTDKDVVAVIA